MENIVNQFKEKLEIESKLHTNDVQLPTVAPAAERPKRMLTLEQKLVASIATIILFDSLFASFSVSLLALSATYQILTGIMLMGMLEALVQQSWEPLPTFSAILRIYWPYLRTALIGDLILSVGVGLVLGTSFALYHLYTKGFQLRAKKASPEEQADTVKRAESSHFTVVVSLLAMVFGTAAMPVGIFAIRWWNGASIDAATENYIRSTVLASVGCVFHAICALYRQHRKARSAGVKLIGDDEVPLGHPEGANENVDVSV